ncbi:hypothetical protein [Mycetocola saprophilus]|uniref:hypothetical protein n=1 Tax=Mycetocola saprophilus TaxID=76636 RepID=UPI003BF22ED8
MPTPDEVRQTERDLLARGLDTIAAEMELIAQGAPFPIWYRFRTNADQLHQTADSIRDGSASVEVGYAFATAGRLVIRDIEDDVHESRAARHEARS